jgi:hypothetical protein
VDRLPAADGPHQCTLGRQGAGGGGEGLQGGTQPRAKRDARADEVLHELRAHVQVHGVQLLAGSSVAIPWSPCSERMCGSHRGATGLRQVAIALQFKRAANIYFLVIGTLYTFESISPVSGITRFGENLSQPFDSSARDACTVSCQSLACAV